MKTKTTVKLMAAVLLAVAGNAVAKPVSPIPDWNYFGASSSPVTIDYIQGQGKLQAVVNFSPAPADIWSYDDNVGSQDAVSIKSLVETKFNLTPDSLFYVSQCDSPTSDCTNATGGVSQSGSNTYVSDGAYNYLAVHFGHNELLFHWASNVLAGTVFEISGLPAGLSNYRAFTDNPSEVPLPAAAWLFGSALLGFVSLSNRRKV